jgi:hypothetical protein
VKGVNYFEDERVYYGKRISAHPYAFSSIELCEGSSYNSKSGTCANFIVRNHTILVSSRFRILNIATGRNDEPN